MKLSLGVHSVHIYTDGHFQKTEELPVHLGNNGQHMTVINEEDVPVHVGNGEYEVDHQSNSHRTVNHS